MIDDTTTLIYNKIFPFLKVPSLTDSAQTLITMKFGYKPEGEFFKLGKIYFYIMTHYSLIKTDYGMLRYDFIVNEIDKLFNMQRGIGIGKLPFYEMSDTQINNNWLGAYIGYKSLNFN